MKNNSDKILNFDNYKRETITLEEWLLLHHGEDERREIFLNMDKALKYIHNHGYCIGVFHPSMIEVINEKIDHIKFNELVELSSDSYRRKKMINEDIFNSSLLQISIYLDQSNTEDFRCPKIIINPDFLKENFDEVSKNIPSSDVPYYRGVVERGASVYLCEYAAEKINRDLQDLEKQLGDSEINGDSGRSLVKSSNNRIDVNSMNNDIINDGIYRQINGMKDAAFVSWLLVPTLILTSLVVIGLLCWIFSLI